MFKKVLIANRGEIALRVIRACRELGIATVAVHSTADADALHVRFADEAVCIGPPPSTRELPQHPGASSRAAEITGADAIHPGYGFLSENAEFAEVCAKCGLDLHRPAARGDAPDGRQGRARADARRRPACRCCPGTGVARRRGRGRASWPSEIGFPVILKATAGGGGRGMKIVRERRRSSQRPFATAPRRGAGRRSATRDVYLERYVERAAPHRDPGRRRPARQRRPPRRARVLDPAPPPEADRGGAVAGADRRAARTSMGERRGRGDRRRSATRTSARSSSCSTRTAASTSWR